MKNFNMTAKLARVLGVVVFLMVGRVLGDATYTITCKFSGDVVNMTTSDAFVTTATPAAPIKYERGERGDTIIFSGLLKYWTGKITIRPYFNGPDTLYGYEIVPKDIQITDLKLDTILNITIKDTSKPDVKIWYPQNNSIYVNEPFTFYYSVIDNSGSVSIRHDYSTDSGKTWDSLSYKNKSINAFIYRGDSITFKPPVISDYFLLRTIVVDANQLSDTATTVLQVKGIVGILNQPKNTTTKITRNTTLTYDLTGRKITSTKKSLQFYIRNNRGGLIIN